MAIAAIHDERIQILQKAGLYMRKIIICNVTMKESVIPLVYESDDKSLCISQQPVTYPIFSCLNGLLSADDSVKIVLLCKCDPNGNYLRNIERFRKEFSERCGSVVPDPEYRILKTEFDEDKAETERLLSMLGAECEDSGSVNVCREASCLQGTVRILWSGLFSERNPNQSQALQSFLSDLPELAAPHLAVRHPGQSQEGT